MGETSPQVSSHTATGTPKRAGGWSRVAERGSLWGLRFTARFIRLVGPRISLALVYAIVTYFFLTDRPGRRASRAYLKRVYATPVGQAVLGRAPGFRESYRHYREFALAIVDRLIVWTEAAEDFEFETPGLERFDKVVEDGRGAIILGAHLGNFDALRLLAKRSGMPVNVLMYTANAEHINAIMREFSPESAGRVITVDPNSVQSVFAVRERLRRGEHVAILADRIEAGDRDRTRRVPLLGSSVDLPQAPFLLAALLECPVAMMVAVRRGPRRYRVYTDVLAERVIGPRGEREAVVAELLTAYARRLDDHCTREPYQWFNFFDYWGDANTERE